MVSANQFLNETELSETNDPGDLRKSLWPQSLFEYNLGRLHKESFQPIQCDGGARSSLPLQIEDGVGLQRSEANGT